MAERSKDVKQINDVLGDWKMMMVYFCKAGGMMPLILYISVKRLAHYSLVTFVL